MRHTSSRHAAKHTMIATWSWRLGRVKQVYLRWLSEEELCDREPSTRCMSPWQRGHFHSVVGCAAEEVSAGGLVEQSAAERQHPGSSAVGEQAEVADARKASRQHMLDESAQELFGSKYHRALLAVVRVVLPAEADLGS